MTGYVSVVRITGIAAGSWGARLMASQERWDMSFYRLTFVAGLAVGFVAGTRAGRERYDQMVQWAKTATDSPAFQKAASTVQTQASGLVSAAGQKVADRAPRVAQSAMNSVSEHVPLLKHRDS